MDDTSHPKQPVEAIQADQEAKTGALAPDPAPAQTRADPAGAQTAPPRSAENTAGKQRGRQFKPGQSGNPLGRPKGSRNKKNILCEQMLDDNAVEIMTLAIQKAKEGDRMALRVFLERLLPKRQRACPFDHPAVTSIQDIRVAIQAVSQAVHDGMLTPDEGRKYMDLFSAMADTLSRVNYEERLANIEKQCSLIMG
jgi:hypothetical protein